MILLCFCCWRRYKDSDYQDDDLEESAGVDSNVISATPDIIMTREARTEDLFTGKRIPFGVHSSMTNIPDEVENDDQERHSDSPKNTLQPNGFRPQHNSSPFLKVRQNSTKSNSPSFSDYAGEENASIHY